MGHRRVCTELQFAINALAIMMLRCAVLYVCCVPASLRQRAALPYCSAHAPARRVDAVTIIKEVHCTGCKRNVHWPMGVASLTGSMHTLLCTLYSALCANLSFTAHMACVLYQVDRERAGGTEKAQALTGQ